MKLLRRLTILLLICHAAFFPALGREAVVVADSLQIEAPAPDTLHVDFLADSLTVSADSLIVAPSANTRIFNPDPTRATWLSILCPGLGQVYNRRYWKLPVVVGAYMGLAYATDWNNTMLRDYTKAYRDLTDNDPDTKSYMDFFAPNVKEENLSRSWLESVFQSRKNYFRRNRDLCIVGMIGVYLLAIVDAYVDASLAHFDISPDLSMNWSPILIQETRDPVPSIGVQWALTF